MAKIKFQVTGMTCAACSARVEKVTKEVPGVEAAAVNLLTGTMEVTAEKTDITQPIIDAVSRAGYGAAVFGSQEKKPEKPDTGLSEMKKRLIFSAAFLLVLMYFTMGHMVGLPMPGWYLGTENALVATLLQLFLTLPVVYLNRVFFIRGLKTLWNKAPNMDSLIAVGSGASLLYGLFALFMMAYAMGHQNIAVVDAYRKNLYFESAAMILTLITLGKFLETRAKGKTGDAIRQLMDLNPKTAVVKKDGKETEIPVEQVQVGDVVIVRSGGRIPVDGVVLSGRGAVDQSALTGESVPVDKSVGDKVATASINTEGYLEIEAQKVGEDTTLAQIIHLVEQAGGSKAPIARLADKIAGVFVPVVMSISFITFVAWMLAGEGVSFSLTSAIAVLVISCPCALGLATPVAIMVGTGRGAGLGILFKSAEVLENLHHIDTVVLDKTGTLTAGKPAVTDILPQSISKEELLKIAVSLERKSEHLFAKAIVEKGKDLQATLPEEFETVPGMGVCGVISGKKYFGGNSRYMESLGISVPAYPELAQAGKTPLYFASEDDYLGAIAVADVLKTDSAEAVVNMKKLGLSVVMLTGDNRQTANAIAQQAGVTEIISDVLPADKAGAVEKLQKAGHRVLMVGDGINDAPALATADVGMAIGSGTDIAIDSADVVLMQNSLCGIGKAVELSKATIRNIKQNLFWAFFYNCLGIPIAAGVLYPAFGIQLSPMLGAAAMSISSVFVVTNALRLRFFRPKAEEKTEKITKQEEKSMETVIKVEGMVCPHCQARVENACKGVAGVTNAVVDLQKKQVTVTGDASAEALKKAIVYAGYEVIE